jgi:hypothetical protein
MPVYPDTGDTVYFVIGGNFLCNVDERTFFTEWITIVLTHRHKSCFFEKKLRVCWRCSKNGACHAGFEVDEWPQGFFGVPLNETVKQTIRSTAR